MSSTNAKQAKCVVFVFSLMIVLPVTQSWGSCAVPTSPGVNICSPLNGSTVSSPFTISAVGKDSVTTDGMDVWLDGQKVGWFGGTNAVTIQQSAAAGPHQLDIFAVGINGELQHATSTFSIGSGAILTAFHLSGTVTGEDGLPVANAELYLDYVGVSCGVGFCHAIAYTSGNGSYTVDFTASRGAMRGPAGTENAFAFANVWPGTDYENDYRYILAPGQSDTSTQYITQNFQLRRRTHIRAGDSIVVTISPDDTICNNNVQDMHPWPTEFVCRTVRITVPVDGTLTVEALANQSTVTPTVETEWQIDPCCHEALANPRSFFVPAGTEVKAQVEMPWGTTSSSFLLKTSIAPQ